ncbi:hypothetical protein D7B24_002432 [Verticillium nonalfalfae]|uniref:DUF3824 domain-containing protein n=1 Tax=Verticillium nonalfalfae TaxID=1051616 RepID=A0A3M9YG50_9PEZI|nr:uncharacterized protein D7B24_002432 [Verticillium nonalfalfae]RNJ59429.1 hypothetical protein D7B24_002432 [Verticillium nonalfalfae]
MARHQRYPAREVDAGYPPYDEPPRRVADPYDPYPPPRYAERQRRQEPSYHDDRFSRDYPSGSTQRNSRDVPLERHQHDVRPVRGASEMRPSRGGFNNSPEPAPKSRRGRSEAPRSSHAPRSESPEAYRHRATHSRPAYDRDDDAYRRNTRARAGSLDQGYGPAASRERQKYPPRAADTRHSRYPAYGPSHPDDAGEDDFRRPTRARTQPIPPPPQHHERRAEPDSHYPTRGRARNMSRGPDHDPYHEAPSHAPPRSRSVPSKPTSPEPVAGGRSKARKAAGYAAIGAATRMAIQAGAQAAYKLRDDPSPWMGEKGVRVATAALGAGLVDGFVGSKRSPVKKGGMRHQAMKQAAEAGIRNFVVQPATTHAQQHVHDARKKR